MRDSLLRATLNTRPLLNGVNILRSDALVNLKEEDFTYLSEKDITTIIDLRRSEEVEANPSDLAHKVGFSYFNCPIIEGSEIPESVEAVPTSYMIIANAKSMPRVFKLIANVKSGVMYNCSAGKDRTGVVSAILLLHAGVEEKDIIENYVATREYLKTRLEAIRVNYPKIDINIVTPCEWYMEEFLRLFKEEYGDTNTYFKSLGLEENEVLALKEKLCRK